MTPHQSDPGHEQPAATAAVTYEADPHVDPLRRATRPPTLLHRATTNTRFVIGGGLLLLIAAACLVTLPWTTFGGTGDGRGKALHFNTQVNGLSDVAPTTRYTYERVARTPAAAPAEGRRRRGGRARTAEASLQVVLQPIIQPGLYADAVAPDAVRLRWILPAGAGGGSLVIERARVENFRLGDFVAVAVVEGTSARYDDAGLSPNAEYLYRLTPTGGRDWAGLLGTDKQGRSLLGRVLLGGVISLSVGVAAAAISVVLGLGVGLVAGYAGGRVDAVLMRFVDVMYGLPYLLLVIMFQVAFRDPLQRLFAAWGTFDNPLQAANIAVLFLAIGLVSWLTMARVVRGQVLSLRDQPFVEAARAAGVPGWRIFSAHLLPNLVGPVTVYATLTVPQAILQESFLSFLGIGVGEPVPSWGTLAAGGLEPALFQSPSLWWQLVFPCVALAVTLLSLNFVGDGLRDLLDPRRNAAKL